MSLLSLDVPTCRRDFGLRPFALRHQLSDHPLFAVERLLRLAQTLPEHRVEYNAGELPVGLDPKHTPRNGLTISETIQRIEECKSWMVLKNVERDPEYANLLHACLKEVADSGHPATQKMSHREAFVFLSSPGSITPFHIDPEQNFLLQIRGQKFITVFDAQDRTVLPEAELQRFYNDGHRNLTFCEEWQSRGQTFELLPGQGVHVPVTAPHWVRNGPTVSISFSITFQNVDSETRAILHRVNGQLRRRGWNPRPAGCSPWLDRLKVLGYRVVRRFRRIWSGSAELS
ncbi:MAG: transcription factor [Gemmataceae bacterium]